MKQTFILLTVLMLATTFAIPASADSAVPRLPVDPATLLGPAVADTAAAQGLVRVGEETRADLANPDVTPAAVTGSPELVWSQRIEHAGATYVAPHFSHFNLPAGATLVVRSPDGTRFWDYTGTGKADLGLRGGFWGIHIPGDTAILELYSSHPVGAGAVRLDSYAHGFVDLYQGDVGSEAICGVDDSEWAQCYQNSEPVVYDHSRAVLRLLIGGTSACTGWLVGDAGHVLTNQHCIGTSNAAQNTDYEALAERSCGTDCTGFGACPGTVIANSGTLIRTSSSLDYALIQLPTNPTGTYGFLQMRGGGATIGERIYIPGHPGAWGKRISVASSDSHDPSGFCEVWSNNEPPCSGGPGDTGYYCDTQGGSSGSPVLGYSDHLVVSLHHCAFCPNRGVPIEAVISDMGADVPPNSVVGGPPPPSCSPKGDACSVDGDCCSGKCRGPAGGKSCK